MKKLNYILTISCLAFSTISTTTSAEEQSLGKYPQVYAGDNYKITMLRLGKEEENTVLIKVDGVDNDYDGEIFKHTKRCDNTKCSDFKYETKEIPGKERWWTIQSSSSWGYDNLIAYPPGISKKTYISKLDAPKDFDSKKFYKEYLGQKSLREKKK